MKQTIIGSNSGGNNGCGISWGETKIYLIDKDKEQEDIIIYGNHFKVDGERVDPIKIKMINDNYFIDQKEKMFISYLISIRSLPIPRLTLLNIIR